jgi:outer membrane lipopolysaccharide assembly protein LptE/RlpB
MTQSFNPIKRIFIGLILALSTGCSFHLASPIKMPLSTKPLYLETQEPYSTLTHSLITALQDAHISLTTTIRPHSAILSIEAAKFTVKPTVIATNQQLRTYHVRYTLRYSLKDRQGRWLIPPSTIFTDGQTMALPQTELAISPKLNEIKRAMETELIHQLLYRLATLKP